jgi:CHAD domain-containing protein
VDFGQKELSRRTKKFLQQREPVLKNEESEDVHDMRVASRRLRATLDACQPIAKRKAFQQAYRQVGKATDLLGVVRDADVMKQCVEELLAQASTDEHAGGQWLLNRLSTYREQRQQELEAFFQDFDDEALKSAITACLPKGGSSHGKS